SCPPGPETVGASPTGPRMVMDGPITALTCPWGLTPPLIISSPGITPSHPNKCSYQRITTPTKQVATAPFRTSPTVVLIRRAVLPWARPSCQSTLTRPCPVPPRSSLSLGSMDEATPPQRRPEPLGWHREWVATGGSHRSPQKPSTLDAHKHLAMTLPWTSMDQETGRVPARHPPCRDHSTAPVIAQEQLVKEVV